MSEKELGLTQSAQPEKDQHIAQLRQEAEEIVDGLGNPMDEGIREPVVSFLANDFPTIASCEGHVWTEENVVEGSGPSPAPWIDIAAPEPESWEKDKEKERAWKQENARQQVRMYQLLDEFYKERQVPTDVRLTVSGIGDQGMFRVSNMGRSLVELLSPEKQVERQTLYRQEMNAFGEFLRQKYYDQE